MYKKPNFGNKQGASEFLYSGLASVTPGPGYTQSALIPGVGSYFVAVALFSLHLRPYCLLLYTAETNVSYLTRKLKRLFIIIFCVEL
jgi:AGCS family alanine or glycine:cation symporter